MSIQRWGVWSPESFLCQVHYLAGVSPCGKIIMTAMGIFLQGCPKQRLMDFTWSSLAWWCIKNRTGCIHYPQEGAIRSTVEACELETLICRSQPRLISRPTLPSAEAAATPSHELVSPTGVYLLSHPFPLLHGHALLFPNPRQAQGQPRAHSIVPLLPAHLPMLVTSCFTYNDQN